MFKRKTRHSDRTEDLLDTIRELIRDLPRADYNRLKASMDLVFDAYQKVRNVKTKTERENEDIDEAEKKLDELEK